MAETSGGTEVSSKDALRQTQEVLKSIFSYYNVAGGSSATVSESMALSSMRFQRMALDANMIDELLTTAKVDLIFHKVCGVSPHMNLHQFLDGIVRIAVTKFPDLPQNQGVLRLFDDHLASFSDVDSPAVAGLDDASLVALGNARAPLQTLYEGYFESEVRPLGNKVPSASVAQAAFAKILTDFEVLPELVQKSIAFQVFREISRIRKFPPLVITRILGDSQDTQVLGRSFTYVHFAAAMVLIGRKCFADSGTITSLARLFEWMDSSKGRGVFASSCPGHLKKGTAGFRLAPEKASGRRSSSSGRKSIDGQHHAISSSAGELSKAASSSASEAVGLCDDTCKAASPAADGSLSVEMSPDGLMTTAEDQLTQIKPEIRRLVLQIFGHYAAIGNPLNRSSLSSQKFLRFLRDCGLVASEVQQEFQFLPGERKNMARNSMGSRSQPGLSQETRSSMLSGCSSPNFGSDASPDSSRKSAAHVLGGSRESFAVAVSKQRFTVSSSKFRGDGRELPLRIFPVPLLTQVEADLIIARATRIDASSPAGPAAASRSSAVGLGTAKRSSSWGAVSSTVQKGIVVKRAGAGSGKNHNLTPASFLNAVNHIALRCYPASRQDALECFGTNILAPLSEILVESTGQDVSRAAELMLEPPTLKLLECCQPGLEKVYGCYAYEHAGRRACWTSESLSRFAEDFDIHVEVGQLALHKIFRDCTHYESVAGRGVGGEMTFNSFQLALLMLAQKVHFGTKDSTQPLQRVIILLHRCNTTAGSTRLSTSLGKSSDVLLFQGLPSLSSLAAANPASGSTTASLQGEQKARASSRSSASIAPSDGSTVAPTSRSERHRLQRSSAVAMSWASMMQGAD